MVDVSLRGSEHTIGDEPPGRLPVSSIPGLLAPNIAALFENPLNSHTDRAGRLPADPAHRSIQHLQNATHDPQPLIVIPRLVSRPAGHRDHHSPTVRPLRKTKNRHAVDRVDHIYARKARHTLRLAAGLISAYVGKPGSRRT